MNIKTICGLVIQVDKKGVTYNLGLFKTEQEGAAAVAKKRKEVCH